MGGSPLIQTTLYLTAMVITVPLAKRWGIGAVLSYLIAGALLGPHALGWLSEERDSALHLAEFGVIMMLFLIGLELRPALLWKMRGPIFGMGALQMAATTLGVLGACLALGASWQVSVAAGLILALSSTAIVLQTLQEKGLLKTTGGENTFSVLLFQDIAVIPILALLPFLATTSAPASPLHRIPGWMQAIQTLGAVALVISSGRFLIRPLFRWVAGTRLRELSTAMALLLVLATTLLMNAVGLSPALGAFLAGVVLAESEYRHQLEADIEPFKGLLLGVFFISIGAGIDFHLIAAQPLQITLATLAFVGLKWLVLWVIASTGKLTRPDRLLFAFSLAQGGEFAFVLLNFSQEHAIFDPQTSRFLTAVVALSMAAAPLLIQACTRWLLPSFSALPEKREPDRIDERDNPVIIAGFGRFGQTVARLLRASGFKATVLDYDAEQVEVLRRFGMKSFYGDASNMDLLEAAGIARARILILAIDDAEKTLEIIQSVQTLYPKLKILARAYDRIHAYKMIHLGVNQVYIETSGSALQLGVDALTALGLSADQSLRLGQIFRKMNEKSIQELARVYHEADENTFIAHSKEWLSALEKLLQADRFEMKSSPETEQPSA